VFVSTPPTGVVVVSRIRVHRIRVVVVV